MSFPLAVAFRSLSSAFLIGVLCLSSARGGSPAFEGALNVSQKGLDLIVKYEVGGGKAYYDRFYQRPVVPAWRTTASGVTVGIGYDCGYNSRQQIYADWSGVIAPNMVRLLQGAAGKKGRAAYLYNRTIRSQVRVTYAQAERVFKKRTLPRFARLTARAFGLEPTTLHPHCNGALVSLVFNRGASMRGGRRKEMRWIKYNLHHGHVDWVPGNIKSMKRLWNYQRLRGLHLRRDDESRLFLYGRRGGF